MFSQKGSRFRRGSATSLITCPDWLEQTIYSGVGNAKKSLPFLLRERAIPLLITWQPKRKDRFESFGAGEVCSMPNALQRLKDRVLVVNRTLTLFLCLGF